MEIKAKINKWDLIKIKSFCTTEETISKVKRQPSEWKKIIANEATDKQLISKIYKQLLKLNSRKINVKETKETIRKINKAKSWFFEKINKIDKPLARLIKKQREKNQINKIRKKIERSQQTTQKYKGS